MDVIVVDTVEVIVACASQNHIPAYQISGKLTSDVVVLVIPAQEQALE